MAPITEKSEDKEKPGNISSPLFRLKVQDLSERGVQLVLENVQITSILQEAVNTVLALLYPKPHHGKWPDTRSVTLVLEAFDGVAYTVGKRIDDHHKEIHLSTSYVETIGPDRMRDEIFGVLTHEMVHCYQWNAQGTAPGGLIEGMADWVRLKAQLGPPHWARATDCDWDAGYDATAYFLEWYGDIYGGTDIPDLNMQLQNNRYDGDSYWKDKSGRQVSVSTLWEEYTSWVDEQSKSK